jgi:hypothetical protein
MGISLKFPQASLGTNKHLPNYSREEIKRHFYYYINEHIDKSQDTCPALFFFVLAQEQEGLGTLSSSKKQPTDVLARMKKRWQNS